MNKKLKVSVAVIIIVLILIIAFTFFFWIKAKTITAKEGYDYALSLAQNWSSDSKLAVIYSHEGGMESLPKLSMDATNDPNVGDGKAVYWRYVFSSDAKNKSYEISIDAELRIFSTEEREGSFSYYSSLLNLSRDLTISKWNIDSDVAIKKALENDQEFSTFHSKYHNATYLFILRDLTDFGVTYPQPVLWEIEYGLDEANIVYSIYIDALDGTVLHWDDLR